MSKMAKHSWIWICFVCFIMVSMVIADRNQVTSISGSGVCFYGKTAERVLNILATGNHRYLLPSGIDGGRTRHVLHLKDCSDLKNKHSKSDVYRIYPDKVKSFKVYCDMDTDGGSWTVIQRRINGKTDFFRGWKDYEDGFGSLDKELWLGNSKISRLTLQRNYELRIDLEDFNGNKVYAKYSTFYVGGAATKYKLHVGGYSGTAGDGMGIHNGQVFSTKERDNDTWNKNCAESYKGGWWYTACYQTNINGFYLGNKSGHTSMCWMPWKKYQSMKTASMMIRIKSTN